MTAHAAPETECRTRGAAAGACWRTSGRGSRGHHFPDRVVVARSLRASGGEPDWQLRRGMLTRDILLSVEFLLDEREPLVGRHRRDFGRTAEELAEADAFLEQYRQPPGQTGHCELDLGPLMEKGIAGIAAEIAALHASARATDPVGETAKTYESFLLALEGLGGMIARAADAATAAAADAAPSRRRELLDNGGLVPPHRKAPPRTFRDAIQLLWFANFAVMHGQMVCLVVPGHLDRTLPPFYEADVARGRARRRPRRWCSSSASTCCINEFIADGLAMSVMVGGRDAAGRDVTNELSYLCLEALRRTRLVYPTVGHLLARGHAARR